MRQTTSHASAVKRRVDNTARRSAESGTRRYAFQAINAPAAAASRSAHQGRGLTKVTYLIGAPVRGRAARAAVPSPDRKSTRLNSSHMSISYAVFCLKKKKKINMQYTY